MMSPLAPLLALTLHHPQVDLQKLRPALEWMGRADLQLRPERIERWCLNSFGIAEPFDPKSMVAVGLDPKAPIKAMVPTETGPLIVELAVADAKKVDAALAGLTRGKPVEVKGAPWAKAVIVRPAASRPFLLARVDMRLIAQELSDTTRVLELFREGEAVLRPKKGKGALTVEIAGHELVERGLIEIELPPHRIEATANVSLTLAARLIADDFVAGRSARRYLGSLGAIAELSGTAGPGALREALIEAGMTSPEADAARKLLAGEHAVALTKEGVLAGVVRLSGSASKKEVAAFVARLSQLQPGIQVRDLGGFLLGWFPGDDPKTTIDLSSREISGAPRAGGAVELRLDARPSIAALRKRARTKVGPMVPPMHLTLLEALYENLLRKTGTISASASRGRQALLLSASVEYE